MEILYARSYIGRELYVIKYKGKCLEVYASSGLNAGRKGRILPFGGLSTSERHTISREVPGYIYKEMFFNGRWLNHRKEPSSLGAGIEELLLEIEDFISDKHPAYESYEHIKTYEDILPIAKEISLELKEATKGLDPFDWADCKELPL